MKTGSQCACEERLQRFNAVCNVDDETIQCTSTSNCFWMGVHFKNASNESTYQGLILHSGCPLDYCIDCPVNITLDNLDIQCNHNHFGTLCGSCREGYSIALGTLHCLPNCSNDYLALILPFTLSGIALVVFILLLGLTVTAGTINGLIFYANIIHIHQYDMFFPVGTRQLLAWLNLDLGIETCFYHGMTTYAYAWLQFIFPFYVWFLIGMIIVVTHYSSKLTKILGNNPVAALATLFLLSYSKILDAILTALSNTKLQYPGESKLVWWYDGSMAYGQGGHFALLLFAILVLIFLFVPYTLLLFFAHWLQALSHWRILSWLNKIKPFIDTYHAPYKKQTCYWTGLLLFVRLSLVAVYSNFREVTPVVIIAITAILLSIAWMHKGIYESSLIDIFEAVFLVNLCIFVAVTNQSFIINQAKVGYFFVGVALACFSFIVLHHIYLKLCSTKLCLQAIDTILHRQKKTGAPHDNDDGDCQHNEDVLDESKFSPTQTVVHLREPLLEQ